MKKIFYSLSLMFLLGIPLSVSADEIEKDDSKSDRTHFTTALTAGYVFKHDCRFKQVYGRGVTNVITADGCYYPWELWGFGAKLSYWRAKGHTAFLHQCTILQQIPVTLFIRKVHNFECCKLQPYASLGGGFIWTKEKSYLATERTYKGIGEVEVGLNWPVWRCMNVTGAFRYAFPPQKIEGRTTDIGGCDLRAGIGFSF